MNSNSDTTAHVHSERIRGGRGDSSASTTKRKSSLPLVLGRDDNYVTIDQTGDDAGFSHVRPMSALAKSPSLRRAIDVRAAARLLDGVVTEETG